MKKQGLPQRNELVVCKVEKLYPNSVSVVMLEYGQRAIIHVSEVALRWVTDIREFVKEGQFVVCRVLGTEGNTVSLSIKRVRRAEKESRLNEFNRERKAEKILELVAKALGKTLEDAEQEVGTVILEEFGSLTKALDAARKKPQLLTEKGVPGKWADKMTELIQRSESGKTHVLKARLTLMSTVPNGVEVIKAALKKQESKTLSVKYLSAPAYLLQGTGNDRKQLEVTVTQAAEAAIRDVQKSGGSGSFTLEKK